MEKEKNDLVRAITGLIMLFAGVCALMIKIHINSTFLEVESAKDAAIMLLVLLPMVAGLILWFIKPLMLLAKIITLSGFALIIIVATATSTITITRHISAWEWILYIVLIVGGIAMELRVLFNNIREGDA